MIKRIISVAVMLGAFYVPASFAHLQLLYTPELLREKGGNISLKMPFTHPADSGLVMQVEPPERFFMIKKGQTTDLLPTTTQSQWTSAKNTGIAYETEVKLRGLGDYVFVYQMAPYFEPDEDIYIQQISKTIVNVGSLPTDWNKDFGLVAEIVPLTKPYAIYEGGTFTGIVKSEGKPVPFAEIEVEYMNYAPDVTNNLFSDTANIEIPADAFITMTLYADANGTFTFGIPKAGQWGFAALGVGPKKAMNGKELSQDAVIWVQAHPVKSVQD